MQAAAAVQTPAWGGLAKSSKEADSSNKDTTAGPKTWKGVGEWQVTCDRHLVPQDPVLHPCCQSLS